MHINCHQFFAVAVDVNDIFLQQLCFTESVTSHDTQIWFGKCLLLLLLLYVAESFVLFAVSKR